MKKLASVSTLIGIVVLLILLVVGSAAAGEIEPMPGGSLRGGGEPEPGGGVPVQGGTTLQKGTPAEPSGAALRIDFQVAGHKAHRGLYVVQREGGDELTSWFARGGEEDSGWISNLDLGRETIWVKVLYYPGPDTTPTVMKILNHAPGTAYGWVSQGMGHALEVAWPDQPLMGPEWMMGPPQKT